MDEGQRIQIIFLHFDIELDETECGGNACECDWLEIEGVKYCGEKPYFITITSTNTVDIKFISDDYDASNAGFLAIWVATT